jgi:hypothetical protein
VALPLILLADAVRPGQAFFFRDILGYWLPQVESLVHAVAQGDWPLWNPYFAFGSPMLADASYQMFYPTTCLNLVLPPAAYYKLLAVSHMALAGVGTFRLARRYGLTELPAFFAAALWIASGPYVSTVSLYHHFTSASWMPWLLLRLEDLLTAPCAKNAARLSLIAALQLLGGSGDLCLMSGLAAAARFAAHAVSAGVTVRHSIRALGWAGLAAALGFGVAAAQWIPTLSLVAGSGRSEMTAQAKTFWSLSPLSAVDLLFPQVLSGAPLNDASRAWLYEQREPFLTFLYLGAATLPLAVLGAVSTFRARAWLTLAALMFFCFALGGYTPWYATLARLPPLGLIRYPVKYLVPFGFFWCLLAGCGLDRWRQERAGRAPFAAAVAVALGLGLTAAAGCLFFAGGAGLPGLLDWLIHPLPEARSSFVSSATRACASVLAASALALGLLCVRWASESWRNSSAVAIGLLALIDLARVTVRANPGAPEALLRHTPPVAARLRATTPEVRVFARGVTPDQLARGPANWDAEQRWSLGLLETLRPPAAARFRVFGSYDGDFTGLAPAPLIMLSGLVERYLDTPLGLRLLQLGAVDNVVEPGSAPLSFLHELPPAAPSVFRDPIRVFEVPAPLPRVYAVDRARVVAEPASYIALAQPEFDPRHEVILAPGAAASAGDTLFAGRARLVERRMDRLTLEAELSSNGYLVVVEAYDTAWTAQVDGRPAPVLRANVAFRAVAVPGGRHRIDFAYRPRAALWGLIASAVCGSVAIVWAVRRA